MALTDIVAHSTLKNGLLAYYKLEGNARDSWGTNNGTAEKAITTTTGKLLNCISFDGPNDSNAYNIGTYQCLNLGQLLAGVGSFSFAAWVNLNAGTYPQVVSIDGYYPSQQHPEARFYFCHPSGGSGNAGIEYWGTSGKVSASTAWASGSWVHWAFTIDYNVGSGITTLNVYKNGVLAATDTDTIGGPKTSTLPLLIGAKTYGSGTPTQRIYIANGKIDEIAISNRAWTAAEVADLYNSGNALPLERQPSVQNHPTLKTGLVSYWALEGNANDTYGSHPGSLVNNPTVEFAKSRLGYRFNGSTQGIRVAHHSDFAPSQFSASMWVKHTGGSGFRFIFSKESLTRYFIRVVVHDSGTYSFAIQNDAGSHFDLYGPAPRNNLWDHLAATFDGSTLKFYVNNAFAGQKAFSGSLPTVTNDIAIAFREAFGDMFFTGSVDEIGFWNRALTIDEVSDLYNNGIGIAWDSTFTCVKDHPTLLSGMLSYHSLDDNVIDATQQSHNGTITGSPKFSWGKMGKALTCSSGNYVTLQNTVGMTPSYISIAAWAKRSGSTDTGSIVGRDYNYALHGYGTNQVEWLCRMSGGGYYAPPQQTWNTGTWNFIVGAVDSSYLKISVNGGAYVLSGGHGGQTVYAAGYDTLIGKDITNTQDIDSVGIWDRPIDQSEVNDLYNFGNGLPWQVQPADINTSATLKTGLVGYWTFDSSADDVSGNSLNGTLVNNPPSVVSKLRKGYRVSDSSDTAHIYWDHATKSSSFNTPNFTYSCWVYPTEFGDKDYNVLLSKAAYIFGVNLIQFRLTHYKSNFGRDHEWVFTMLSADYTWYDLSAGVDSIVLNTWAHLCISYDGSTMSLYLNGNRFTLANPKGVCYADYPFRVGYFGSGTGQNDILIPDTNQGHASRKFDELGFWNRALSADEVAQLYNSGIGITYDATYTSFVSHATLRTDLLAYWSLNGHARDWIDSFHGTLENSPTFEAGKILNCCTFNGSNQDITFGDSTSLSPNRLSIACWFKNTLVGTSGSYALFCKRSYWNGNPDNIEWGLHMDPSNDKYWFQVTNGTGTNFAISTTGAVSRNTWHHGAATYDGVYIRIYIDGALYCTPVAATGNIRQYDFQCLLGAMCAGTSAPYTRQMFWTGSIDDAGIWSRALSDAEISNLYNSGYGLPFELRPSIETHNTLKTGLVSYWSLNGNANDNFSDHHGTLVNSPTSQKGRVNGDFLFSYGSQQGISIPHHAEYEMAAYSVSAWVRPTSYPGQFRFLVDKTTTGTYMRLCIHDSGQYALWMQNTIGTHFLAYAGSHVVGQWDHLVGVFTGTSVKIYRNGAWVQTTACSGTMMTDSGPIWIGRQSNGSWPFDGDIDEVGIWNRELDAGEVADLYCRGAGLPYWKTAPVDINTHTTLKTGLVSYWTLDSNANDCVDSHHGTLTGSPTNLACKLRNGYLLNGSNQYLTVSKGGDSWLNLSQFTYSVWVCPNATTLQFIICKGGYDGVFDDNQPCIAIEGATGKYYTSMRTTGNFYNSIRAGLAVSGVWAHIVVTFDGTNLKIYQNGVLIETGVPSGSQVFNSYDLFFGRRGNIDPWYFNGKLDEVGLWNRALASTEVLDLYNDGAGITWSKTYTTIKTHPSLPNSLLFYLPLDGNGNDATENGFNATLASSPPAVNPGKLGTAYKLGQVGRNAFIPYNSQLEVAQFTGALWAKSYAHTVTWFKGMFCNAGFSDGYGDNVRFQFGQGGSSNGGQSYFISVKNASTSDGVTLMGVSDGVWNHWGFTYDGSFVCLYKNGLLVGKTRASLTNPRATSPSRGWRIGYKSNNNTTPDDSTSWEVGGAAPWGIQVELDIDEVFYSGKALTESEMFDLYNLGAGLLYGEGEEVVVDPVTNFLGTPGPRRIAMTWTNPGGSFAGVTLRRREDTYPTGPTDGTEVYRGALAAFTDQDLDPTKTYYYSIFAFDSVPNYSTGVSDDWIPLELPVVTDFVGDPGPTKIAISWTNPTFDNFDEVMLRRSKVSTPLTPTDGDLAYQGTGESRLDEDLDEGDTYYYSIFVFDTYGEYSDAVSDDWVPGDPPKLLTAVPTFSTVVRVTYNLRMKATNPGDLNDALRAANYVFTGDESVAASSVTLITVDPTVVDVNLDHEMADGEDYLLTISNVQEYEYSDPLAVNTYEFVGIGTRPKVSGATVVSGKVRITFNSAMRNNSALTTPGNYLFDYGLSASTVTYVDSTHVDVQTGEMKTGQLYTVTVSNVEGVYGSPIEDPPDNQAEFSGVGVAPQLNSEATQIDYYSFYVDYSEVVNSSEAEDEGNYLLDPALTIDSVEQVTGTRYQVTLSETLVALTDYTTTVSNVHDLVGNLIDPAHDTAAFTAIGDTPPYLYIYPTEGSTDIPSRTMIRVRAVDPEGIYKAIDPTTWNVYITRSNATWTVMKDGVFDDGLFYGDVTGSAEDTEAGMLLRFRPKSGHWEDGSTYTVSANIRDIEGALCAASWTLSFQAVEQDCFEDNPVACVSDTKIVTPGSGFATSYPSCEKLRQLFLRACTRSVNQTIQARTLQVVACQSLLRPIIGPFINLSTVEATKLAEKVNPMELQVSMARFTRTIQEARDEVETLVGADFIRTFDECLRSGEATLVTGAVAALVVMATCI